ncbi:MAG: sodium:solute symporter [Flavobacteriales bacterium]|nr:sodium:solute symporter [Flavobacteriales bacterium]
MSAELILGIIGSYFLLLIIISIFTSKKSSNATFFTGNRQSPWYLVAFGMIGASLSGVTFISIPGSVGNDNMSYMQIVMGYFAGYLIIALVLLPLYYKLNLTSIYGYLQQRFGNYAWRTGAFYFLISRLAGSAIRLLLVANVLHAFVFQSWGISFESTVIISIALIWVYTFRGGIKTVVWTDTLQTLFMLAAVGLTIGFICSAMNISLVEAIQKVKQSPLSNMLYFDDWRAGNYFWKHFIGGMLITICMTGLDQDMMQKNLTCRNIHEAQKNMLSFSITLVFVNLFFLFLGAMLYIFAANQGIELPKHPNGSFIADQVYPIFALKSNMGMFIGIVFILGLVAAAYSSADGTLTALTTSIYNDFLNTNNYSENKKIRVRKIIHIIVSLAMLATVVIFKYTLTSSAIKQVLFMATLTYGPLLGLFAFGILSNKKPRDRWIPFICILSPVISYFINTNSSAIFGGYQIGYELLAINGLITYIGLSLLSIKNNHLQN